MTDHTEKKTEGAEQAPVYFRGAYDEAFDLLVEARNYVENDVAAFQYANSPPDPLAMTQETLRLTSRLMLDGARPNWRAMERNERRPLRPLDISSRSRRLSPNFDRFRSAGRMPPLGESTEKTEDEPLSKPRPIELMGSPRCQRSQISDRCAAE